MIPSFVKEREEKGEGFDLYFAGAHNTHADEYLLKNDGYRLQSQLIDRTNITRWCSNKSDKSKFFIDSGAYTAHTKGIAIDVDEYIDYLNSLSEKCTIFAQLDTIPGRFNQPKTAEEVKEAPKLSWHNYLYMRARLKEPNKLLPIFHQGENFKWLTNILEWTDDNGEHIPYIGISPANDVHTAAKEVFISKCFDLIAHSNNPEVKTHAFGMTSLSLLEIYPFYSADSTSWKMAAAMGNIYTPYGPIYVSDRRPYDPTYIKNQSKEMYGKIEAYVNEIGFTFEDVVKFDYTRYIVNIHYLMDWARNYRFKGINKKSIKKLF